MKTHYLLVGLGTGNTRVALACSDGTILGLRTVSNTYYRDDAYGDAQYFLPEEWQKQILRCCRELHREFPDIRPAAMSSAGARQSIVLLDRAGRPFYGLPNIDNRGREYMDAIQDRDTVYRLSGKWVTEDFCAAKLLGFRMRYPELYEKSVPWSLLRPVRRSSTTWRTANGPGIFVMTTGWAGSCFLRCCRLAL